ncbi:MAG: amidohydrolase [Bacteroidia bacterium]|nr:amidohydrolase [Bacteroidia bacterium]NND25226.1 amidohydrolase [Flavobacteriaceae bacterium]MBT8279731.1 amidohydrolase [Bacteroidia bacterium]NNK60939.1 amidohydrolase [Flavobacteriaceae bacterium]NNL33614.1 amidohydrolase [Flavobacteriaceae bacterium]
MQDSLKIALIQSHLIWENPEQNRINFELTIDAISEPIDFIILPEMFTSGFTMNPSKVAETMDGTTVKWMTDISLKYSVAIGGSLVIQEEDKFYNRFVFALPNGDLRHYDKRHTFTLAGEHKVYGAGKKKVIFEYKGWKICPQVCYDLRFPVWARNLEDYDLLIYVASWPKPRIDAWDALLKARAIENMSYCVGVNRVGLDANNYEYPGHSAVYDGLGKLVTEIQNEVENTFIVELQKTHLTTIREKLRFLEDRDQFNLLK